MLILNNIIFKIIGVVIGIKINKVMYSIENVVDYLNRNYTQSRKEPIPLTEWFDKETIISFWDCGAFVLNKKLIYEIHEDDGNWFGNSRCNEFSQFDKAWLPSKIDALQRLAKYSINNTD